MRSLIILEVEHGEDTDLLTAICEHLRQQYGKTFITDYTVRVDVPACFVLDSGNTDERE